MPLVKISFLNFISRILFVAILLVSPLGADAKTRECTALFETFSSTKSGISVSGYRAASTEIDGRTIYYEHLPASRGKGTAIMFIGIYTPIVDFAKFKQAFSERSRGEGLILMSYDSMPDSLEAAARNQTGTREPGTRTNLTDIGRDATAIVNAANIRGPVTVVGYSYGSAPAATFASFHRERVADLVFTAPLVFNGEHNPQALNGLAAVAVLATYNPFFGKMMIENAHERAARSIGEQFVADHFDSTGNPAGVDRQKVLEGAVGRIRATEDFDLRKQDFGLMPPTHFLLGENENPHRLKAQTEVIAGAIAAAGGEKDRRPTVTLVPGAGHIVVGTHPNESADGILLVMRNREAGKRRAR